MNKSFKYSLLQYVHSELLGERVNIGLIVFFPFAGNHISFLFPQHLKRLKNIYPDINERKIKYYLETINKKLTSKKDLFLLYPSEFNINVDFFSFIDSEILKQDDSSLQFSSLHESLLYTEDIATIKSDLYNEFFTYYSENKPVEKHITEATITSHLIKSLSSQLKGFNEKVKRNVVVHGNDIEYKFDAFWQNGTSNYVKAISFDISTPNSIQQKSVNLFGSLSLLQDVQGFENNRYDLIIAQPSVRSVFKEYTNALNIIDKIKVNKQIIEYCDIDIYTHNAISCLSS